MSEHVYEKDTEEALLLSPRPLGLRRAPKPSVLSDIVRAISSLFQTLFGWLSSASTPLFPDPESIVEAVNPKPLSIAQPRDSFTRTSLGMTAKPRKPWKEAITYQVYPLSYADSNGDGIGDLNGIASKVDVLEKLGVDYVWLCPIYKSPLDDNGYDISDYRKIHKAFGTMKDWQALLDKLHARGMKLVMDLVVNHTSALHPWFLESRSSRSNPKRHYYIWRPARYGADGERLPPNNWMSSFRGGSAWTWDEVSEEYYLHIFGVRQPDLNWENPAVREEVHDLMRFWLDKGIDGFRLDVINFISKQPGLPDAPIKQKGFYQDCGKVVANGPRVHEYLREMYDKVLRHYDVLTVGECPASTKPQLLQYIRRSDPQLEMVFDFELMGVDNGSTGELSLKPWTLPDFKKIIIESQNFMYDNGGWDTLYHENHDQARSISRFASDSSSYRALSAKMLAILQVCQSGNVFIYQGQDIGQINNPTDWTIKDYPDVKTQNFWQENLKARRRKTGQRNPDMSDVMKVIQLKARDNGRTPMQWNSSPNAGFSSGQPWMRVHEDFGEGWNVEAQMEDPGSVWHFWRRLFLLRKERLCLVYGDFTAQAVEDPDVFAFRRDWHGSPIFVLLNFSSRSLAGFPIVLAPHERLGQLLIGNYEETVYRGEGGAVPLRAWEGLVFEVESV